MPVGFELKNCILEKIKLHKFYISTGTILAYNNFAVARKKCKNLSKQCYNDYLLKVQRSLSYNPKYFWKYVRHIKESNSIPRSMCYKNNTSDNCEEISNMFGSYFGSGYNKQKSLSVVSYPTKINEMVDVSNIKCILEEVFDGLKSLGSNTSPGPDLVPEIILSTCHYCLSVPIYYFFQLSLSFGFFADQWKLSYIIPIFKSGNKNSIINYLPISKISALPTFMEKLNVSELSPVINSILLQNQHGLGGLKFISTNLIVFYTELVAK